MVRAVLQDAANASRRPGSMLAVQQLVRACAGVQRLCRVRPHKAGWKSVIDVEIAVAEYVDWFNHRRLHGEIGLVPPAEFEANHWAARATEHYPENPVFTEVGSN